MAAKPDVDLEGLPDVEATMDFTNPKDCIKAVEEFFYNAHDQDPAGDHTVLIIGYPNKWFNIDDDESSLIPGRHKALYLQDSQILLLTMPGRLHELAASRLNDYLVLKLNEMGCFEEVISMGRETASIDSVNKEPDASWGPVRTGAAPDYATCVVEAAVSESSRALSLDARIWLEPKESHVTQVIGVKIYQRPEIVFQVWTRARQQRGTRSDYPPRAVVEQEVRVTLQAGRPVANGTLRISFEKLFERKPRRGTAEGDMIFSGRELGGIARLVWLQMGHEVQ